MSTNRDLKKNRVYICSALFKKKASDSEFNINHHLSMLDNKFQGYFKFKGALTTLFRFYKETERAIFWSKPECSDGS